MPLSLGCLSVKFECIVNFVTIFAGPLRGRGRYDYRDQGPGWDHGRGRGRGSWGRGGPESKTCNNSYPVI